jgi:UDP-N-acetyl-D-galactosamine dehydrogenase
VPTSEQIVVVGLGYVGLPLAVALARRYEVVGLDIDERRVGELKLGVDRTREVDSETLKASPLRLTCRAADAPERTSTSSPCRLRSTAATGRTSAR